MNSKVIIEAGICGFTTEVLVKAEDMTKAEMEIKTNCPNIGKMKDEVHELNPLEEFIRSEKGKIMKSFNKHSVHASCPVVSGMIKAVEVAAGLALPKDVRITVVKED